jgi:hypothetical protein
VVIVSFKRVTNLFLIPMLVALVSACGGGGGGGSSSQSPPPITLSTNADLVELTLSDVPLDQTFQASQLSYTASANFLTHTTTVTPITDDANATVTVNGAAVISGADSGPIELNEEVNTITVLVTAEDGTATNTYTVEVTVQTADHFAQQAYIKASDAKAADGFGSLVALSGDTLAVSGLRADAVYVFTHENGIWTEEAILKAPNAGADGEDTPPLEEGGPVFLEEGDRFGQSIALFEDTLAVGAPGEDSGATGGDADNSAPASGAVYIFSRSNGAWNQEAFLKASNAEGHWEEFYVYGSIVAIRVGDGFGASIALSEDTVLVGAPREDSSATGDENDNSAENAGAVYVFNRADGVWNQEALLKSADAAAGHQLGRSIALSDDTLAVQGNGGVYFYSHTDGSWKQEAFLDGVLGHYPITLSGDTLAVGNSSEDDGIGAVYVYTRNGATWTQQAHLKASNAGTTNWFDFSCDSYIPPVPPDVLKNTELPDYFGISVALSGDNLVVGARGESSSVSGGEDDNSALEAGAAYVFTRETGVWNQKAFLKASNAEGNCSWDGSSFMPEFGGDQFGQSVAISGDTIAVGAIGEDGSASEGEADNSSPGAGAVYVFQ